MYSTLDTGAVFQSVWVNTLVWFPASIVNIRQRAGNPDYRYISLHCKFKKMFMTYMLWGMGAALKVKKCIFFHLNEKAILLSVY